MQVVELDTTDAPAVASLYADHEWWADRDVDEVREALVNTELALGIEDRDRLIASARVITDTVFYATVYDVVVAADRRGEGVGRELVEAVVNHDLVAAVETVDLRCREGLVPFYRAAGFEVHDPLVEVEGHEESFVKMNYEG